MEYGDEQRSTPSPPLLGGKRLLFDYLYLRVIEMGYQNILGLRWEGRRREGGGGQVEALLGSRTTVVYNFYESTGFRVHIARQSALAYFQTYVLQKKSLKIVTKAVQYTN